MIQAAVRITNKTTPPSPPCEHAATLYLTGLESSQESAGSDQGPGFDRAGAAGRERALPRAPAAIRGAGVGGGAGSAGWRGWLARGVISARDGGSGAAAGSLWESGLSMGWVSP